MIPTFAQLAMSYAPRDINDDVIGLITHKQMTEQEIATALGLSRYAVFGVIKKLTGKKMIARRRVTKRRSDGEGYRKVWKYKLKEWAV